MKRIQANKVLFIKLGQGGKFERECIESNQTLRLGYREVDHKLCITGQWDKVHDYFITEENSKTFVATSHSNQIKQFYEEDEKTLWITFYANKLWWCKFRSHPDTHSENIRTVIPGLSGHLFWIYPDSHSGFIRTLL